MQTDRATDGKQLAVSEEEKHDVRIIDYETRAITWTRGVPDVRGSKDNLLNHRRLDVELAAADEQRQRGLVGRSTRVPRQTAHE